MDMARNVPARARTFKVFRKLDAAALRWIKENVEKIIEMHEKEYAGRVYTFVNYYKR